MTDAKLDYIFKQMHCEAPFNAKMSPYIKLNKIADKKWLALKNAVMQILNLIDTPTIWMLQIGNALNNIIPTASRTSVFTKYTALTTIIESLSVITDSPVIAVQPVNITIEYTPVFYYLCDLIKSTIALLPTYMTVFTETDYKIICGQLDNIINITLERMKKEYANAK